MIIRKFTTLCTFIGLALVLLLTFDAPALACTSFAVYGKHTMYGMNFDYANVELQFSIVRINNRKVFQVFFIENKSLSTICGINSRGVFSSIQMLYPQLTSWPPAGQNQINLYQAYSMFEANCDSLQQAYDFLNTSGAKVVHISGTTFHDFFADTYHRACVLEVGSTTNYITKMKGDYLVMTNFPNYLYADVPPESASGTGADRYLTACHYLEATKADFTYSNAMDLLQRTAQTSGGFLTQCSLIFDPGKNELYIVLKHDFTKVWKVSVDNETIETYSGFSRSATMALDSIGITSSSLAATTGVQESPGGVPTEFILSQNYPNPFNPSTVISYTLPAMSNIRLSVVDVLGREVAVLAEGVQSVGQHSAQWDARNVSSGMYFYRLEAGQFISTRKMLLIR